MTSMPPLPRRTPMPPAEWRHESARTSEALEARDALAAALSQAGIQLPAMDVRTPWADVVHAYELAASHDDECRGEGRYALVHLRVCSAPVALALAAVIVKGTGR